MADEEGVSLTHLAEKILTAEASKSGNLHKSDKKRLDAEEDLFEALRQHIDELKAADNWSEHVTAKVFDFIKYHHLDTYKLATSGNNLARINRQIGATVRQRLRAEVKMIGSRRATGQPSRKSKSLISSYTLLCRTNRG